MTRDRASALRDEKGFVLVAALSCLVVLSMIGIAAMNSANMEKSIAHNINLAEKTFYGADGGTEVAIAMVERNIACDDGWHWAWGALPDSHDPAISVQTSGMDIFDVRLAHDESFLELPWDPTHKIVDPPQPVTANVDPAYVPSDAARSMRIPDDYSIPSAPAALRDNAPHLNIATFGTPDFGNEFGDPEQGRGYNTTTAGGGSPGTVRNYQLWVQNLGINNAEVIIRLGWQHMNKLAFCEPFPD